MIKASQPVVLPAPFSFNKLASRLLYALIVLLPLLFWPGALFSFEGIKKYFFLAIVLVITALYLFNSWRERHLYRLSSLWLVALWAPTLVALFASLASPSPRQSLIGLGVETDTFFFLIFLSLLATLVPLLWRTRREVFNALLVLLSVGFGVILFQILRVGLGNFTMLNVFSSPVSNLLGKWNEVSIFSGFTFLLSLAFIKFLPWRRTPLLGGLIVATFTASLLTILFINYWLVLLAVGVGSILIWLVDLKKSTSKFEWLAWRSFLAWPLLLGIIFVLLSWFGQPGNFSSVFKTKFDLGVSISNLNNKLGVGSLEVSPSWAGTWVLAKSVLNSQPVLGVGPNKFSTQWFKARPLEVNETPFWQDEFRSGVGLIPTAFITMGLVGFAAYLFLLGVILWSGYRLWRERETLDSLGKGINLTVFVLTVYLWFFNVVYTPGIVILALTFLLTGLLITNQTGLETDDSQVSQKTTGWLNNFFTTFGFSGGLIASFVLLALVGQSFWSNLSYNRGMIKVLKGDLTKGEVLMANAASLNPNDLFYRSLVEVDLSFLDTLLRDQKVNQEEAKTRFQNILSAGIGNAKAARDYDQTNYLNWVYLGRVYEAVVPLKVNGAYEEAVKVYTKAKDLNPNLPSTWLNLARLEITAGNTLKARNYLDQALKLKRNYTEAIFVLAQLDASSGNLSRAIGLAEQSVKISGNDPVAYFSLGLLKYQAKDYIGARAALEPAVQLNPNYANARYFLGLTYDMLGNKTKALEQFQVILSTNNLPEIKQIILNLQAGRGALVNMAPPAPEDRKKLPVKEKGN